MSAGPVKVSVFGKTDLGRTRDHNEDTFLVADLSSGNASLLPEVREHEIGPRGSLFMVADGMGGAAAGELASAMAADLIYRHLSTAWAEDEDASPARFAFRMKEAVELANQQIYGYAREHPEVRGMGTTVTAAGVFGDQLYLAQIGDSRGYLVRNGSAIQLTQGPVADAAAGGRGRADRGRGRAERAAQHHPPGARPRSAGQGRPQPPAAAPRRHAPDLLRRAVRAGEAGGVRGHGGGRMPTFRRSAPR